MRHTRFVSSFVVCVVSVFLLASAVQAQNVTTWHNDMYRTGEQLNESILSPSTNVGTITVPTSGTNVDVFGLCSSQSGGCMQ